MAAPASADDLLHLVQESLPLDPTRLAAYVAGLRQAAALPRGSGDLAALLVRDGFLTPFQADHLMCGRRPRFLIGKYLILDRIGAGGMGAVYFCEHLQLGRQVALKVLPADQAQDSAALVRFQREARAVAALDHPNIVRAYDVDMEGRTYFLVMEYVDGVDLQELVARRGRLDPARAADYVRQAAVGLQHAHAARLVHRDVKPANLLLSRTGVVKILDLGLARFFHEGAASVTDRRSDDAVLGTADYVAPEQARDSGDVDVRADIYSLGATFYFLLAGRAPFADGTLNQKLLWHQMKAPPPLRRLRPEVTEAMAAVVARMMAKAPADRYQTPADVAAALAPWTRSPPVLPASDFPPPRSTVRAGRPWRTGLPSSGSTVVERPNRASAATGASTVPNRAPAVTVAVPTLPCAVPLAAPVTAAAPAAQLPADDDWSNLFDDSGAGKPSSARRRRGKAISPLRRVADLVRRRWRYLAGGGAAVLLMAGVCLVIALLPIGRKPAIPATGPGAETPSRPRGPAHLRALMKGADAIELTWEDPDGPSSGFRIDRAADAYFTKDLHSFSVGPVRSCTDAELKPGATYYYRVRALRTAGESSVSNTAWPLPNYGPDGFTTIGLDLNGGATVADKVLHLTDLNPNEARSAFYRQEVDVHAFRTKFRFRIGGGPQTADGFTFCIQSGDSTLLGQPGGGLGYQDIPKSVAVKFDLWNNDGEGQNSTGLFRNGDKPSNPGALDLTPSGIDLHSGRPCDAAIDYKDGKLTLLITDAEDAKKRFAAAFDVDVPNAVGDTKAHVGFTGGTGGVGAAQDVLSWSWESTASGD